jgi:hypothetical protein
MCTSFADKESKNIISGWVLLGEYSPAELLLDLEKSEEISGRLLTQMAGDLRLPVECVQSIARIMNSIFVQPHTQSRTRRGDSPGRIRIFCQKKMMGWELKGGWGYFVVEPSRDASPGDCLAPLYDIYIYEEGG